MMRPDGKIAETCAIGMAALQSNLSVGRSCLRVSSEAQGLMQSRSCQRHGRRMLIEMVVWSPGVAGCG